MRIMAVGAVFCSAVILLSLTIVPVVAASTAVQHESVDVVVEPAHISISVSPDQQNVNVVYGRGNRTGDSGTVSRPEPANGTTVLVIRGTITPAEPRPTGQTVNRGPGQLVTVNYSILNQSATPDSHAGDASDTVVISGATGSTDAGTPASPPPGSVTGVQPDSDPCAQYSDGKHLEAWQECIEKNRSANQPDFSSAEQKAGESAGLLSGILKKLNEEMNAFACIFGGCQN